MADYPYEGQLIADPVTFQRATNAQVTVYDANDTTNTTPLALKDATGLPMPNPLTSSADAFTRPFYAPSQDVKLVGAGLTVFVSSAKGMRDAAAASASSAQAAAASASTAAGNTVTSATVNAAGELVIQKASGTTVNAGPVKGPKGDKGDKGQDGSNVLPTDDAVEQAIKTKGSKTEAALSATYAPGSVPPDITGSHTRGYDRRLNTYNLKPKHLRRIRAAIAAVDSGASTLVNIVSLGDSISVGDKATRPGWDAWPVVLRNLLAKAGHTIAGTGIVLAQAGGSATDTRWSFTGNWTKFATDTETHTVLLYATPGSTATFTSDLPGTSVDVYFSDLSGEFTVSVDSGAAVTVKPGGGEAIGYYGVDGLPNATHTVTITPTSGTLYLGGAGVRQSAGVLVHAMGLGGCTAEKAVANGKTFGLMEMTAWRAIPSLLIIGYMTNEALTGISVATYKAYMQTLIDKFKGSADIVLSAATPMSTPFSAYRTALYELADTNDLPVIDNYDRWAGDYVGASNFGLLFTDNVHLTTPGYGEVGRSIFNALSL